MEGSVTRPFSALMFYLILILVAASTVNAIVFDSQTEVKEYCETDSFQAYCDDQSVIVITEARYGRMKLGRCVKKDLGYMGCHKDVLGLLDARCSGRQSCQIRIPDAELDQTRPCLEELKTYLEAGYQCVHVEKPLGSCEGSDADLSWSITRSSRTGFISTGTMVDTHCGTEHSPIRISSWPGQRLNITVYDFSHTVSLIPATSASAPSGAPPVLLSHLPTGYGSQVEAECGQFVVLVDPESRRQIKICPGSRRARNVYVSSNRSVDVFFKRVGPDMYDQRFLIQYTVLGCAEIRPAEEMWLSRNENEAHIGCRSSEQKWRLTCVENRWQGLVGNCSSFVPLGSTIDAEIDRNLEHGKGIAIILCVALLMGIVVLVVGALGLFLRRFQRQSNRNAETFLADEKHQPEVSYCKAMCAAHLEQPEMTSDAPTATAPAAATASCRYIVHHCVCQDGSHQQIHFTDNTYGPVRINPTPNNPNPAGATPLSQAETAFAALFPSSLGGRRKGDVRPGGRGKEGGNCEAVPAKSRSVTDAALSPSHQTSVESARNNALALLQANDACSCGLGLVAGGGGSPFAGGGGSPFADEEDAAKYAFWKKHGSYCPVYGGQCPPPPPLPIAESFSQ